MDLTRQRLDNLAFAAALAAVFAATAGFASARNGAAIVMCGICLAGLIGGRIAGMSGAVTLTLALGLVAILWMVWIDPPASSRRTSALAHAVGGALMGWALATTLRRHRWPAWALAAMIGVLVLTITWELGEWIGDRALDTALIPNRRDSALDIVFGCFGGGAGIAAAWLLTPFSRSPRADRLASPR